MATLKAEHRLDVLLRIAGLARSTFFYHQARLERPAPRAALKADIKHLSEANKGRYGHRRIHGRLLAQGWKVAKKTVLKLMNQLGLLCRVRRRRSYSSYRGQAGEVAPNLEPTNACLRASLETLPAGQAPLVHSDQGFQYQHVSWRRLPAGAGCAQSMSRKGNCLDNAVIESFFGHLKEKFFTHAEFDSVEAFTAGLEEYIAWFNNERAHSYLEGLSPVQYRAQALAA